MHLTQLGLPLWAIIWTGALLVPLVGCKSSLGIVEQRGLDNGYHFQIAESRPFPVLQGVPLELPAGVRTRIYIEGDGHAWSTPTQPSRDPTPRDRLLLELAMSDPSPSVYLARPCQFVITPGCNRNLWTGARFSEEVVRSLDSALTSLKARYQLRDFELVGYSGGGALALLLATRRDDIALVQTLAGNLTPRRWAKLNALSPLDGSLEPLDFRKRLKAVPQRHVLGRADEVIAPQLLEDYARELDGDCVEIVLVDGVRHVQGVAATWAAWRGEPFRCIRSQSQRPASKSHAATRPALVHAQLTGVMRRPCRTLASVEPNLTANSNKAARYTC